MKETPFDFDKDFGSEEEAMISVDEVITKIADVISEDEAGTHKLAVYITEVEGWHATIDGGLEKLVLERS